jgi:glutamine synthetase type III
VWSLAGTRHCEPTKLILIFIFILIMSRWLTHQGVNGSGKHNNWSFGTNKIPTLFEPSNPYFSLMLAAFVRAVDLHSDLLRISIASAGNDHRLGGHEAPPAIMSIYLGEEVTQIYMAAKNGTSPPKSNDSSVCSMNTPHTLSLSLSLSLSLYH